MRAEDTLQYMTDFLPEIFPTRKHCLNHLFCVLGNGYKWVNGELIDKNSKYEKRYLLRNPIEKAEFSREGIWLDTSKTFKMIYEDEPNKIPIQYRFNWYINDSTNSLYKGCKFYTAPDNIKPDWKALLEECKQLLIKDGINIENKEE